MTDEEARGWITDRFGAEASERVAAFLNLVIAENAQQNLISPESVAKIWIRHALDSAQLLTLAPAGWQSWIDVGTGGGFPGMIVAVLASDRMVTMVEPRRKRAAFLQQCVDGFALSKARVVAAKIETVRDAADVISARAVAPIENLLRTASGCAKANTTWLLPRGRSGGVDALSHLKRSMFHVEHSLTDPESAIIVIKDDHR